MKNPYTPTTPPINNQFKVIGSPIGEGATGQVFVVTDVHFPDKDYFALKTPRLEYLDDDSNERLNKEAQILQNLSHKNIVKYKGFGEEELEQTGSSFLLRRNYLLMEYLEGEGLRKCITQKHFVGDDNLDHFFEVALGILSALTYLDSRQIVHGDISPENILLANNRTPKIIDFGAAAECQNEYILTNSFHGRVEYRPEGSFPAATKEGDKDGEDDLKRVAEHDAPMRISHSIDVYAAAVVMREMLSAERATFTFIPDYPAAVPEILRACIDGALSAPEEKRTYSALDFQNDLRSAMRELIPEPEPVPAQVIDNSEDEPKKPESKKPMGRFAKLIGVASLAVIVVASISLWSKNSHSDDLLDTEPRESSEEVKELDSRETVNEADQPMQNPTENQISQSDRSEASSEVVQEPKAETVVEDFVERDVVLLLPRQKYPEIHQAEVFIGDNPAKVINRTLSTIGLRVDSDATSGRLVLDDMTCKFFLGSGSRTIVSC